MSQGKHRVRRGQLPTASPRVLLPPGGAVQAWRALLPRGPLHWLSCLFLWVLLLAYLGRWVPGQREFLFDVLSQNDDARTSLFALHRYGPEGALRDDPIALDMLAALPPVVRGFYAALVPLTGLYAASKVVQALCLALIVVAAGVLVRSRRVGLAGGVLLVFLMLHTPWIVNRIAGGLPRAFAFPVIALWTAGALARSERWRFGAILIAAATYPPAWLMTLGAEGLLALRPHGGWWTPVQRMRLLRYAALVFLCGVILLPYKLMSQRLGHLHTFAEARANPAFGPDGRQPRQLPFANPWPTAATGFATVFGAQGERGALRIFPPSSGPDDQGTFTRAFVILAVLLVLVLFRLTPGIPAALALFVACVLGYAAARGLAFRLYAPERFTMIGLAGCALILAVSALGLLAPTIGHAARRATLRNFAAGVFLMLLWAITGDGIVSRNGVEIDGRQDAELYRFIRTLPVDARLACHPLESNIPYWTGRATTDSYETMQPWFVERWAEYRTRTEDTLRALYATRRADVLAYCDKYHITHLVLDQRLYNEEFQHNAPLYFEPLRSMSETLLNSVQRDELVLTHVAPEAVVFRHPPRVIVDVARLRATWRE